MAIRSQPGMNTHCYDVGTPASRRYRRRRSADSAAAGARNSRFPTDRRRRRFMYSFSSSYVLYIEMFLTNY